MNGVVHPIRRTGPSLVLTLLLVEALAACLAVDCYSDAEGPARAPECRRPGAAMRIPPAVTAVPNPFLRVTTFRYVLRSRSRVLLAVHDLQGRLVVTLVDSLEEAGDKAVDWDGRDTDGHRKPAGSYFVRLDIDGVKSVGMVALLR
jgi:hypothetical protein